MLTMTVLMFMTPGAAAARNLQGAAAAPATLPYGVTPCDIFTYSGSTSKYSNSEFHIISDVLYNLLSWSELLQTTWCGSGGGARYTILGPTNAGIAHVLSKLHQRYGTSVHPERFKVDGPPLDYGNDFTGAWDAIWETHLIPFPMDFYNNATVLKATKEHPLQVPVGLVYVKSHVYVYTEKGVVYVRVPAGLIDYDVPIPKAKVVIGPFEKGDNSLIPIYAIDSLLVPHSLVHPPNSGKVVQMAALLEKVGGCTVATAGGGCT